MSGKKLSRRDVLKWTGGLTAGALLAACGQTPPTTTQEPAATTAAGTSPPAETTAARTSASLAPAELVFFFGANPEEAKTRQRIIDAFTAKYPQITVKTDIAEGDPVQELQTQFAGGAGPDVMMAWELSYSGLAERGIFADLGEFILRDPDFSSTVVPDHVPGLLDMFKWKGKQYVLPEQYAGVVLYYNKKLFDEAGVAYPSADWKDASWTYDKFLETAKALTKTDASGKVTQFGFVDAWWPPLSATVLAFGNGGAWFDQYVNPRQSTITDPKLTEGVQFYADLINVHKVAPSAEETQTQSGADMFMGGRAAMALVGHWFYPAFSQAEGLEFDIAVLPRGPQGTTPKTDLGSTGLSISASSKNRDQAWEFVKFATGPEGQRIIAESGLFVPVLRSVGRSNAFLGSHSKIKNVQVFTEAIENSVPLPITPAWNQIADIWARELDAVIRGQAKASDAHAKIDPQIDALLAELPQ
jgi:multiple sugar transport system substrate-binding protein